MTIPVTVVKRADLPRALTWDEQDANMQALADGVSEVSAENEETRARSATSAKHATADYGLNPGATDHTAALVAALTELAGAGFRGPLIIPAGITYDWDAVTDAVPLGVMIDSLDTTNWAQPPSYRNKFRVLYFGDNASDDAGLFLGSPHHIALFLYNDGKAGTTSANERLASILYGVGRDYAGDPLLGMMLQFRDSSGRWALTMRAQVPRDIAMANPQLHEPGHNYPAGAYCIGVGGKVYKTVTGGGGGTGGGIAGSTTPTHTSVPPVADGVGGVEWTYVQGALSIDATRWILYDDGAMELYGPSAGLIVAGRGLNISPTLKMTPTDGAGVESPQPYLRWVAGGGMQLIKSDGSGAAATLLDSGALFDVLGQQVAPPVIASASTIAPVKRLTRVSGTTTISTITPPPGIASTGGEIILLADGAWPVNTAGNVNASFTAVAGRSYRLAWDAGSSKWYPA